jgi:hypothetical protein
MHLAYSRCSENVSLVEAHKKERRKEDGKEGGRKGYVERGRLGERENICGFVSSFT